MRVGTISVVIPTYNRGQWLGPALQSALSQTYPDLDVIVVDDGSTDSTAAVVESFARRGRVRYFYQENRGVAAARNLGVREARGALIAFLDSDDVWYPWKLEVQAGVLAALPELALVCTDFGAATAEGDHASYIRAYFRIFRRLGVAYGDMFAQRRRLGELVGTVAGVPSDTHVYWGDVFEWVFQGNFIHTLTVLCRRDAILDAGGFDESFRTQEDADLYLRIARRHEVAYVDAPSGRYTTNSNDRLSGSANVLTIRENVYRSLARVVAETPSLVRDRPALVRKRLGTAAYELGKALLAGGDKPRARALFLESLRRNPAEVRAGAALLLASLPGNGMALYRWLRSRSAAARAWSQLA